MVFSLLKMDYHSKLLFQLYIWQHPGGFVVSFN